MTGVTERSRSGEKIPGSLTSSPWREEALARAAELDTILAWFESEPPGEGESALTPRGRDTLLHQAYGQLAEVARTAHCRRITTAVMSGAAVERTIGSLNAAEATVLRLAPLPYVAGKFRQLMVRMRQSLPGNDLRLVGLDSLGGVNHVWSETDRRLVITAFEAANSVARKEQLRVRGFRNVIVSTTVVASLLSILIAILGFVWPTLVPLCFENAVWSVCPTGRTAASPDAALRLDTPVVMVLGVLGAVIAVATALRNARGSSDPHSLPVALALLKLPLGALTALLGLLLMRAHFVPGIGGDLTSSAQVVAWAIVLGYAQQLFTQFVDTQAKTVLDTARQPAKAGAPGTITAPP